MCLFKSCFLCDHHVVIVPCGTGYRRVLNTIVTHPNELISLTYQLEAGGEEKLEGTAPHPFYSLDAQAFVAMGDLQAGDQIATSDDRVATVLRVSRRAAGEGESFTTYNFEVEEYHTYFVGEAAIWVHNTGRKQCVELATKLYKNGLSGKTRDQLRKDIVDAVDGWGIVDPKRKAAHLKDALGELDDLITKNAAKGDMGDVVIGKMDDLGKPTGWKSSETVLGLRRGASWAENRRLLQQAMDQRRPIRDASSQMRNSGFLKKEREYLRSHGWSFDAVTSYWNPPPLPNIP